LSLYYFNFTRIKLASIEVSNSTVCRSLLGIYTDTAASDSHRRDHLRIFLLLWLLIYACMWVTLRTTSTLIMQFIWL